MPKGICLVSVLISYSASIIKFINFVSLYVVSLLGELKPGKDTNFPTLVCLIHP